MRIFSKFLFPAVLTLALSGCGGMAQIKSAEKVAGYDKQITSLLVIIDTSHLAKAFTGSETTLAPTQKGEPAIEATSGTFVLTPEDRLRHLNNSIKGLKESFTAGFRAANVDVITETTNIAAEPSAIAKSVGKNQRKQILILATDSFQTSRPTINGAPYGESRWNGKVSWNLALHDIDKTANPGGKAVWTAKTDLFSLGIGECRMDAYVTCTTRFANAVIDQMRGEGLIAKK